MLKTILQRLGVNKYLSSWLILAFDIIVSTIATLVAYLLVSWLFPTGSFSLHYFALLALAAIIASLVAFYAFRTFRMVIRHSTLREIWKLCAAVFAKTALLAIFVLLRPSGFYNAASITTELILDGLLTLFLLLAMRIIMIAVYDIVKFRLAKNNNCKRVLIYGTEEKQISLTLRLQNSPHYRIVGYLTHGTQLKRYTIADKPVYYFEDRSSIRYLMDKIDLDAVLFATHDDAQIEKERLIPYCTEAGLQVLMAPPIDEVIDGKLMKQSVREIKIEDLLGRPEIKISLDEIRASLEGKTILVTGAAGSIGSELCRQLATFGVGRLILFDNAETPMHNLRLELEERFKHLEFLPVIGDVRLKARLEYVFGTFRPQVVFHAAAYKHVPLMEENPCEAVLVNVVGTRNVADFCLRFGVEKMVMISTDKAVNPTNVMGASKRLAEIYVQSLGQALALGSMPGDTRYVTTRFGNVLGSNGSVIPRFREQIEKGGPVTVTHPDITRFFMTIPEACRLVMEAATMCHGNDIFIFDMGESVKIANLAFRMIELAGLRPIEDIQIEYTGLRPGEKLYEEVLADTENTLPTPHEKIRIAKVREYNYIEACSMVEQLEKLARAVDIQQTVLLMKQIVPEFVSQNSRFSQMDKNKAAKVGTL